ncbi:hypothetical protein RvY_16344 [Ramazzottius varieornatus]|uniref:MULE transposase domain-containing protein n=1 Tax=Ramazzottius varieornatus TaxID=947166 RepID=A0A1D1W4J7_RAMVA|nr:hypothetical protein RvY_16344 [Ramazzottius varieornatus]
MLDKDFVKLKLAEEEFPVRRLLCVFHVIKVVKTRVARSDPLVAYKQEILTAFRRALYTFTRAAFEAKWRELIEVCPDHLNEYFRDNWYPIADKWVMHHRKNLPALGNTTNNRIERFNLQY